jgi:hypothetical protein
MTCLKITKVTKLQSRIEFEYFEIINNILGSFIHSNKHLDLALEVLKDTPEQVSAPLDV